MTRSKPKPPPARRVRKDLNVYVLTRSYGFTVIGMYRRRYDAEVDQQYMKEPTTIVLMNLTDRPIWREIYKDQMTKLEKELKEHEYRIEKEHAALRSALSCGEE